MTGIESLGRRYTNVGAACPFKRNTGTGLYRYGALAAFSVSGSHRNGVRFSITQKARPCVLIARSSSRSIMSLTGTGGRFFCRLFQLAPASCDTYTPRSVAAYTMPARCRSSRMARVKCSDAMPFVILVHVTP